ncbi:DUF302 domain-containing protein [Thermoplasma sp.]|uniref:DUF302 domain-containing protein n=1 Tax=Thermoplasma sp. TaxID=1973142 RepID=UPI0026283EDC|nr:DUF302 domain-containing protein [Thermoplasma sp.]
MEEYVDIVSKYTFDETVSALDRIIRDRNLIRFAVFDHRMNAENIGLQMNNCIVFVFGNPAIGTIMMQRDPSLGIELPSKILIYELDHKTHVRFRPLSWKFDDTAATEAMNKLNSVVEAIARECAGLE